MSSVVRDPASIDFARPGAHHYQVAFHLDGSWGYSLVPLTVINGLRPPAAGAPGTPAALSAGPADDRHEAIVPLPAAAEAASGRPASAPTAAEHAGSPGADAALPVIAVFGGTHGNEYEGQVAVTRLCQELDPHALRGRVLLMPQLSESACRAHTRVSPEDGVNMNRAFPGSPRGTLSSRIAHFVSSRIIPQARVVIDLHAGGREAVFPLCTSFHPLADRAQFRETAEVARLFDTPFMFIYSRQMGSGLLTDHAEDEGKIAIGGEFGAAESTSVRGTRHAYEGVRNVLRHYGLLDEPIVKIDPSRTRAPRLVQAPTLDDYVPCPRSGIWEPVVQPGDDVEAGDLIGRLHDFDEHPARAQALHAHRDGVVIACYHGARCPKGATLFVLATDTVAPDIVAPDTVTA